MTLCTYVYMQFSFACVTMETTLVPFDHKKKQVKTAHIHVRMFIVTRERESGESIIFAPCIRTCTQTT